MRTDTWVWVAVCWAVSPSGRRLVWFSARMMNEAIWERVTKPLGSNVPCSPTIPLVPLVIPNS